jgi:hypothetical protein
MRLILALFFLLGMPCVAHAYIGPGLGAGVIGAILGLLVSVFLALFALIWYPIKRLVKKLKRQAGDKSPAEPQYPTKVP